MTAHGGEARTPEQARATDQRRASDQRWSDEEERAAEEERAVQQALAIVGHQPQAVHSPAERFGETAPAERSGGTAPAEQSAARPQDHRAGVTDDLAVPSMSARTGTPTGGPARAPHIASDAPGPPQAHRTRAAAWTGARALAERLGRAAPPAAHRLPLDRALGHVLAESVRALTDLPSFDTSAMDGWVVAGPGPWTVREGEGLLAGRGSIEPLPDGHAVRIATGARLPADATAVIRSEHAHCDEAKGLLHPSREVVPGQDIRPRGQECRSGDELLPVGTVVTPPVLGLAAAAGYDALVAVPRPRVEVFVLGDELLSAGLPREGLIRDALGPMMAPWLRALGAEVAEPRRLGDDPEALRRALVSSDADLILTTGGTAAGPVDHVHPVLAAIGAEMLVDGVAVRPGHPMLLARLPEGGPCLVGLPGNPLAAVSGLLTLAEPLIQGLAGRHAPERYRAPVHEEVQGHPHDTRLIPVVHRDDSVVPLHFNGPAMLRGIAAADGLAVVPPGGVRSGTEVEILDLPWASASPWTEGCFT
ncbi:molybdopterin molybdotransferase MoeA [Streptomyces sp. NPDC059446]|uniref:molybdopterin molybdotransferase MoeA n=1 Tax=Streptomyces sp. NPDC059446 TaxID=3346833 RepID=UPI0036B2F070